MTYTQAKKYLAKLPLAQALWWFIENAGDDDPIRTPLYFDLRERVRTEGFVTRQQHALVQAAQAACQSVNGSDPQATAGQHGADLEALRAALRGLSLTVGEA